MEVGSARDQASGGGRDATRGRYGADFEARGSAQQQIEKMTAVTQKNQSGTSTATSWPEAAGVRAAKRIAARHRIAIRR
jgi:hypothetical protein